MSNEHLTPFEAIGGAEMLRRLVDAFYDRVSVHPGLRPLFPNDFIEIREKQYLFLTQFLGGPALYSAKYGPAMMRQRHLPFPINQQRAEEWLACMSDAMAAVGLTGPARDFFFARLTQVANHFVNQPEG